MRGDRPPLHRSGDIPSRFTPHARGSTLLFFEGDSPIKFTPHARIDRPCFALPAWVGSYPAYARIDLDIVSTVRPFASLPRMRGDRPGNHAGHERRRRFTRMRGDRPAVGDHQTHGILVYPACAGIDQLGTVLHSATPVYPACAGIDPEQHTEQHQPACLPRMRGSTCLVC